MPPFEDSHEFDLPDILPEDAFMPLGIDEEHYLVFRRIPNDFTQKGWELCHKGNEVGHEQALREAIKERPIDRHFGPEFLTVNTTSNNVRHFKVSITVEAIA